jgi:hypothetical protein
LGDVRQFEAIDQSGCGRIDALETLAWFESSPASQPCKINKINKLRGSVSSSRLSCSPSVTCVVLAALDDVRN